MDGLLYALNAGNEVDQVFGLRYSTKDETWDILEHGRVIWQKATLNEVSCFLSGASIMLDNFLGSYGPKGDNTDA